jgi:hypothetical protein
MERPDISSHLIHFTSANNDEDAFKRLQKIIRDKKLLSTGNKITGKYRCVCFSEAPLRSVSEGLLNDEGYSRYSHFGVTVSKQWLFAQGGRPVIYQPASEYKCLPESHRWRHMTYELRINQFAWCDFTWEREWRIQCDELAFDPMSAQIIVRDSTWADRLCQEHDDDQEYMVRMYSTIMDDYEAEAYREPFKWRVASLKRE